MFYGKLYIHEEDKYNNSAGAYVWRYGAGAGGTHYRLIYT